MNHAIRRSAMSSRIALGFLIGGLLTCLSRIPAAEDAALASSANDAPMRVILIGAERYFKASNLVYVINDVRQISQSLVSRGGLSPANILEMIDTAPTGRFQPLRQSILDEVPRWLAKIGKDDQVIVYFTGHGYRAPDGTLYLAPLDIDPDKPAETGIAVSWLRKLLEDCPAQFKLLIIDACHAGAEKAFGDTPQVTAKDLAQPFEQIAGVVTLASCSAEEQSQIWPDVEQSLFSYWLNMGLRGHADRDGDCDVDIDELYEYVHANVTKVAPVVFHKPQTPVRIVGPRVPGVPTVVRLKPYSLKGTLQEMAEQLAALAQQNGVSDIGVPAFTPQIANAEVAESLGGKYGLMPRYCAEELQKRLEKELARRDKSLRVLPHDALHKSLVKDGLSSGDVDSPAIRAVEVEGVAVRATVLGQFCVRTGQVITLRTLLKDKGLDVGQAGGTAQLTDDEWAMLGISSQITPEERPIPPAPTPDNPVPPEASIGLGVTALEENSREGPRNHDPTFPVEVSIRVNGRAQPRVFVDGREYVGLAKDAIYEIHVQHRSKDTVFLRLLVDGLNTLPERVVAKDVERDTDKAEYLPKQRVNLTEARAWPLPRSGQTSAYQVPGFFSKTGSTGRHEKFRVVDAAESFAASQRFTEQIGLITAAFYAPASKRSARGGGADWQPGTGGGGEYDIHMDQYDGDDVPGELLAVVHVRYVSPEQFARLKKGKTGR